MPSPKPKMPRSFEELQERALSRQNSLPFGAGLMLEMTFDTSGKFASFRLEDGASILLGRGNESRSKWRVEYIKGADTTALQASLLTARNIIEQLLKDGPFSDSPRAASPMKVSDLSSDF